MTASRLSHRPEACSRVGALWRTGGPPALTALVAFAAQAPFMGRWPPWGDGLELVAVAALGGVAHPTGYPLYSMLTTLLARLLPEGLAGGLPTALLAAQVLSLASVAVAAGCVCGTIMAVVQSIIGPATSRSDVAPLTGIAGGLAFAFSEALWEAATSVEVYAMHLALQSALLWCAVRLVVRPGGCRAALLAGGLLAGLGLAHHRMALFAVAAFGAAWLLMLWPLLRPRITPLGAARLRHTALAAMLGAMGLTVYLWMPARAAADPPMNWGAPDTLAQWLWSVRGGEFIQYRFLMLDPATPLDASNYPAFARQRADLIERWTRDQWGEIRPEQFRLRALQVGLIGAALLLGMVGLVAFAPAAGAVLATQAVGYALLPFLYNIADIEGYLMSLWLVVVVAMAVGVALMWRLCEHLLMGRPMHHLPVLLLALPMLLWWVERPRPQSVERLIGGPITVLPHGHDPAPVLWASRLLDAVGDDALVLTEGDNDFFALHYAQQVMDLRHDVVVVGTNFLKEPWYARTFGWHQPRVPNRPAFVPETGGGTPREAREFFDRIFRRAVIPAWQQGRPVYFVTFHAAHLQAYQSFATVVEVAVLLHGTEAERLAFALAPPPLTLYRLDPPAPPLP